MNGEAKRIRLGHIGTAHDHSGAKLRCAMKFPELFEIVGIAEEKEQYRPAMEKNETYDGIPRMTVDELLDEGIDAALIEGFELDNVSAAQRCVERGVHVHLDKPAGADYAQYLKLLQTAHANNVIVQLGYMYRYNPAVIDCLARIERGELGKIISVDAIMDTRHPKDKRAWLSSFDAGIMFFLGCHMVDLVYRIMGAPLNVKTYLKSTGMDGVSSIDHTFAALEYENGVSTVRAVSNEVNGFGRRQLVVCGERATYEIYPLESPPRAYLTEYEKSKTYADARTEVGGVYLDGACRYDAMMNDFAAMVRGEKENPYTFEYELQMHKLFLACCGQDIDYKKEETI